MRYLLAIISFGIAPSASSSAQKAAPLRLALDTKLGVHAEFTVQMTDAPTEILDAVSFGGLSAHGRSRLVLLTPDSLYYLIPWALIKEGDANPNGHTVTLLDGMQFSGKLLTEVTAAGEGKKYDLASSSRFTALSAPKAEALNWGGVQPWPPRLPWTLSFPIGPAAIDVAAAHFVFRYYSTAGYVMGGSDRVWQSLQFRVIIGSDSAVANVPDFESISYWPQGYRDSVSVTAPGRSPVSGEFRLQFDDPRGVHPAHQDWVLLVTTPNGTDIGVPRRAWRLARRH